MERIGFMHRSALISLAVVLAGALCVATVVAKAVPRTITTVRPAKVRRLISDGARAELPSPAPSRNECGVLETAKVEERAQSASRLAGESSTFRLDLNSLSVLQQGWNGFCSFMRHFAGGVRPLRC
jgi:hypothetical protein